MEVESVLGNFREPFYYDTFFKVLASIIAIAIIIVCVYLSVFFLKKLIRLFKKEQV